MADQRNCHEYCRFSQYCHSSGEPGLDPDDCPTAWKLEEKEAEGKDENKL